MADFPALFELAVNGHLLNDAERAVLVQQLLNEVPRIYDTLRNVDSGANGRSKRVAAAAPELLKALQQIIKDYAQEIGLDEKECVGGPFKAARAAIAKATQS